jgi:hypothetical protein
VAKTEDVVAGVVVGGVVVKTLSRFHSPRVNCHERDARPGRNRPGAHLLSDWKEKGREAVGKEQRERRELADREREIALLLSSSLFFCVNLTLISPWSHFFFFFLSRP